MFYIPLSYQYLTVTLLIMISCLCSCSLNKTILREKDEMFSDLQYTSGDTLQAEQLQTLPAPVQKWLEKSGAVGKPIIKNALIKQNMQMKMNPDQKKWHKAKAEQFINLDQPGFIWTVKMKPNPLIHITGRDLFYQGHGKMLIRLNSLFNVVNASGSKIDEGALQRYLGEIVRSPSAVLNPCISWQPVDSLSAKAVMNYMGTQGEGIFYFNEEGDFTRFTSLRYMENTPEAKRYLWEISVQAYKEFEGIRVPSVMEATWHLDNKDWTWLKLELDDIQYNKKIK